MYKAASTMTASSLQTSARQAKSPLWSCGKILTQMSFGSLLSQRLVPTTHLSVYQCRPSPWSWILSYRWCPWEAVGAVEVHVDRETASWLSSMRLDREWERVGEHDALDSYEVSSSFSPEAFGDAGTLSRLSNRLSTSNLRRGGR